MKTKAKPVWELTDEEFEERVTPAVEAARQAAFAKGLPISYRDESVCEKETQFIHEYGDGTKYLVEFDLRTRQHRTIRKLNG